MAKTTPKPWFADPTRIIPALLGIVTLGGGVITFFVKDALTQERVRKVEEEVGKVSEENEEQEEQIEDTAQQYQLIQQNLGAIQETLKELKAKK